MNKFFAVLGLVSVLWGAQSAQAEDTGLWSEPVRGSWVAQDGKGLALWNADIVVDEQAYPGVKQAAKFLAQDLEKITGKRPAIVSKVGKNPFIRLATVDVSETPAEFNALSGKWEAYRIKTTDEGIWLVGSNPRGTAFAVYTLAERLGVDPLYIWTGYTPEKHEKLAVKSVDFEAGEPTFKFRGMFHDDEDTLIETLSGELHKDGYAERSVPHFVPTVWYERYFETALRLRMNQVAPFVRAKRAFEVQKTASDWGLFYTSHHYDILLSNPHGYERYDLAKKRGVVGAYDWDNNRENLLKYWTAGVEENKELDSIYPVGLRGTRDGPYKFPKGTTDAQKSRTFSEAIQAEIDITKALLPEGKEPLFHFTLYHEMLDMFKKGSLKIPEEVMLIWNDNGDGVMRELPKETGKWKHGIYYHLAFLGAPIKQTVRTIAPKLIEEEFRKVVDSGATEYMLVNVSELRQHVMNTRFIAEISWDAKAALDEPGGAERFTEWWSREYFGEAAAQDALATYNASFETIHRYDEIWKGALSLDRALLQSKYCLNFSHSHVREDERSAAELAEIREREKNYDEIFKVVERAQAKMNEEQKLFFLDNAMVPLLIDYRPTQAAALMWEFAHRRPNKKGRHNALVYQAMDKLDTLEKEIKAAEYAPFENWYKPTWIRLPELVPNVHYSHDRMKEFMSEYNFKTNKRK